MRRIVDTAIVNGVLPGAEQPDDFGFVMGR